MHDMSCTDVVKSIKSISNIIYLNSYKFDFVGSNNTEKN